MDYAIFREAKLSDIRPLGHLRDALERQRRGLSGHFTEQGYPFDTPMWDGGVGKVIFTTPAYRDAVCATPPGEAWWPYEQSAYLLDGLLRLGILTRDEALINRVRTQLEFVLTHPDDRGLLGHAYRENRSEWPMAVLFRAMAAWHQWSGDPRIPEAFLRHYRSLGVEELATRFRHITNLEGVLQTAAWTGDASLPAKAEAAYRRHNEFNRTHYDDENELYFDKLTGGRNFVMHGVSFCEELKLPVLLSLYTGNRHYLEGAAAGLAAVLRRHEQLPGLPSSNEYFSGRDPLQGYETCVITDFLWTLGYFLMATADAEYADRMEKIAYNALPGAVTGDWMTLQYLSSPNQVIAAPESNHTGFFFGVSPWRQYRINHFPQCCPGNVHRALPNFVARMWMTMADGAPAATLYGPSEFCGSYRGSPYRIEETTRYPYEGEIRFRLHGDLPETMPFAFRIPGWCRHAPLRFNGVEVEADGSIGNYRVLNCLRSDGDTITLSLEMEVRRHSERNWQWFERGPLLFALPIAAAAANREPADPRNYRLTPAAAWDYAPLPDTDVSVHIHPKGSPWSAEHPPVTLHCRARRVTGYDTLTRQRFTPLVPLFADFQGEETELTLVPFGATTLRITAFPDGRSRRMLPIFQITTIGSFPYDFRRPLAEQGFWPEALTPEEFRSRAHNLEVDADGYCDLQHHFGTGRDRIAYLQLRIWSEEAGEAVLALGASQGAEGFLDGVRRFELEPISGAKLFAPQWFELPLHAGYNDLLLKVCEGDTPSQYRKAWGVLPTVFRQ